MFHAIKIGIRRSLRATLFLHENRAWFISAIVLTGIVVVREHSPPRVAYSPMLAEFDARSDNGKESRAASKSFPVSKQDRLPVKEHPKIDINRCTPQQLSAQASLPLWLAERIVKYRDKLGGFVDTAQIAEVYGIYRWQATKLAQQSSRGILSYRKIAVDTASFKTLVRHPYIGYEGAKLLKNYDREGEQGAMKQLLPLIQKDVSKLRYLEHYLVF